MTQPATPTTKPRYPLFEELLAIRGEPLKALYTVRDVAQLFGVSVRAIQEWVSSGRLEARDLPGRGRFLPQDLEALLSKKAKKADE
jgi:excisionase family DNA binding protein